MPLENTRAAWKKLLASRLEALLPTWEDQPILVAFPTRQEFLENNEPLPAGVICTARTLKGKRLKTRRVHRNVAAQPLLARWPEDNLVATRHSILVCAMTGSADLDIGNYTVHLREGQLCLIPGGVPRTDGSRSHITLPCNRSDECMVWWLKAGEYGLESWTCFSHGCDHAIGRGGAFRVSHQNAKLHFSLLHEAAISQEDKAAWITHGILKVLCGMLFQELFEQLIIPREPAGHFLL